MRSYIAQWEEEHEAYKEETRRQEAAIEEQKAKTEEIQRALERWRRGKKGEEVAAHVQPRQVEIKPSKQYLKAVGVLDEFRERRRRRQEASREGVGGAG